MKKPIYTIVAIAKHNRGIGSKGKIPWVCPPDLTFFKTITTESNSKNAVIMGRKTWESIPSKHRPLENRINIIISSTLKTTPSSEVIVVPTLNEAIESVNNNNIIENIFIIGGGMIYNEVVQKNISDKIYVSEIESKELDDVEFDSFFPLIPMNKYDGPHKFREVLYRNTKCTFTIYEKKKHEEYQYLKLIREVIDNGVQKGDRTGVGTLSVFGRTMRFSLRNNVMPLLTTKRTFWKGIVEELLWFIKGETNAKKLSDKGVKIWDGNGSKEFLTNLGLGHREEGDLGPVYGFQWRHFGADYKTHKDNYEGQGVDQLKQLIETLKNNPNDRRMILSAWNPAAMHLMTLPPCHMMCQFYVSNGELSCQMYQRSCDLGLGVPFNIASYSLLTRILAQVCDLLPGEFIHVLGDAHVYLNHIEPLEEQLKRNPNEFPILNIKTDNKDIDKFEYEDFELVGYKPHKTIKMEMAV